jgi:hypothetical protein
MVRAAQSIIICVVLANEIRGFILAAPVMYALYCAGGTWMAVWLGVCSLTGIALSVLVPLYLVRRLSKWLGLRITSSQPS